LESFRVIYCIRLIAKILYISFEYLTNVTPPLLELTYSCICHWFGRTV